MTNMVEFVTETQCRIRTYDWERPGDAPGEGVVMMSLDMEPESDPRYAEVLLSREEAQKLSVAAHRPQAGIREFYVTFGVQYKEKPLYLDEQHPRGMHGNGYAVIEAPTEEIARALAHAVFNQRWAFLYETAPAGEYAPAGEIMRLSWTGPSGPTELGWVA